MTTVPQSNAKKYLTISEFCRTADFDWCDLRFFSKPYSSLELDGYPFHKNKLSPNGPSSLIISNKFGECSSYYEKQKDPANICIIVEGVTELDCMQHAYEELFSEWIGVIFSTLSNKYSHNKLELVTEEIQHPGIILRKESLESLDYCSNSGLQIELDDESNIFNFGSAIYIPLYSTLTYIWNCKFKKYLNRWTGEIRATIAARTVSNIQVWKSSNENQKKELEIGEICSFCNCEYKERQSFIETFIGCMC